MKKLILILIMMLLHMVVSAAHVSETMGPYKVSFDLPIEVKTNTSNTSIEYGETFGGIGYTRYHLKYKNLTDDDILAFLYIFHFNIGVDQSLDAETYKTILDEIGYPENNNYNREIDSYPGIVVVGDGVHSIHMMFFWEYYKDNHTLVRGYSIMPWEEGTLQLLKTIHIEKINSTA